MRLDQQIIQRLNEMSKGPYLCVPARVEAVNREDFTCTAVPVSGERLTRVRIKASVEGKNDGLVQIPVIGSSVLIVLIGNTEENAFVAKFSEVEEVLFYGGEHGGLIKVNELRAQLDKNTNLLKAMLNVFSTWPSGGTPDGGLLLAQTVAGATESLPFADYSNIENPKVKH